MFNICWEYIKRMLQFYYSFINTAKTYSSLPCCCTVCYFIFNKQTKNDSCLYTDLCCERRIWKAMISIPNIRRKIYVHIVIIICIIMSQNHNCRSCAKGTPKYSFSLGDLGWPNICLVL